MGVQCNINTMQRTHTRFKYNDIECPLTMKSDMCII